VLAVDLGATNLRVALGDERDRTLAVGRNGYP
jgi:sugar (pentulose or hexulose) kinase